MCKEQSQEPEKVTTGEVSEPDGSRTARSAEREKQLEGDTSAGTALWEWEKVLQEADKSPGIPSHRSNKERDALRKRATAMSLLYASSTVLLASSKVSPAEQELWGWCHWNMSPGRVMETPKNPLYGTLSASSRDQDQWLPRMGL